MFWSNKQKPNFVFPMDQRENAQSKPVWSTQTSALLCKQQHKFFPRGQHWTLQVCAGPPAQESEGSCLHREFLTQVYTYLCSSCCAVQVPGLLQGQWEPSLCYLSHPQLPSAGALPVFLFLSQRLKCTSCALKFAAHLWKCKLGSL